MGGKKRQKDAKAGTIVANESVLKSSLSASGGGNDMRLALLKETIDERMCTYPSLSWFPELETFGGEVLSECIKKRQSAEDAARRIQAKALQLARNALTAQLEKEYKN